MQFRFKLAMAALLVCGGALAFFTTQRHADLAAAAGDPRIAAAGDIACDPGTANFNGGNGRSGICQQKATYNLLNQGSFAAILALGDTQYFCGGYQAYLQSYNLSWGNLLAKTYPVVGNHEYLTSPGSSSDSEGGGTGCDASNVNAAGYFKYFAGAAQEGTPGRGWYSFDVGRWHLIALNSNCSNAGGCGASTPQGTWLAQDLAAHKSQCLLAFWHIPFWSSGGRAELNTGPFVQQLYSAHADVILNGHEHLYERFALQDPSGNADKNGVREFIAGTGGANHTPVTVVAANSQFRNASDFGILELTLHAASYDWSFVSVSGAVIDSGSQACHNATATPPPTTTTAPPPTTTARTTTTTPSTTTTAPPPPSTTTVSPSPPSPPTPPAPSTSTVAAPVSPPPATTTTGAGAPRKVPLAADLVVRIRPERRTLPAHSREKIRVFVANVGRASSARARLTIALPRQAGAVSAGKPCVRARPVRCTIPPIPAGGSVMRIVTVQGVAVGAGKADHHPLPCGLWKAGFDIGFPASRRGIGQGRALRGAGSCRDALRPRRPENQRRPLRRRSCDVPRGEGSKYRTRAGATAASWIEAQARCEDRSRDRPSRVESTSWRPPSPCRVGVSAELRK